MRIIASCLWLALVSVSVYGAETAPDFSRAIDLFRSKDYAGSQSLLESLVKAAPGNVLYHFNLANSLYAQEKFAEAIAEYDSVANSQSPLAPAAKIYGAKALRRAGNAEEAARRLAAMPEGGLPPSMRASLMSEKEALAEDFLSRALAAYRNGDFAHAESLVRASRAQRESASAHMLLGLVQLKQGRSVEARDSLEKARAGGGQLRQEAEGLLDSYQAPSESRISGNLDVAGGYNSNAFGVGDSAGPMGEGTTEVFAGVQARLASSESATLQATYQGIYDEIFNQASLRYFSHLGSLPARWVSDRWTIELAPQFRYERFGGQAYQTRLGALAALKLTAGSSDFGLRYTYAKSTGLGSYGYLTGHNHVGRAFWTRRWIDLRFTLAYEASVTDIGDYVTSTSTLPLKNTAHGALAIGRFYFATEWEAELSLGWHALKFDSRVLPDNFLRRDQRFDLAARLTRNLSDTLAMFVSNELAVNNSNLGRHSLTNKNYRQNISMVGLSWSSP